MNVEYGQSWKSCPHCGKEVWALQNRYECKMYVWCCSEMSEPYAYHYCFEVRGSRLEKKRIAQAAARLAKRWNRRKLK